MSYEVFKNKVTTLLSKVGGVTAEFSNDADNGRFFANCSDGTTLTGHAKSLKVTVKWGSGHTAMAAI